MSRSLCYVATAADAGMRLDVLLAQCGAYESRSAAARAIDAGQVLLGGKQVARKHAVSAGDAIVYVVEEKPSASSLAAQPIPLDIRFEDDYLLVLSKQAGLVCHPSVDHVDNTLVNALLYHCGTDHVCNVQGENDRQGIVHRLDRDTSGLMLAAKTDQAGYALMEDIAARRVDRRYLTLVHGIVSHDTGMVDAPIARAVSDRTKMAVRDCPSARDAVTTFRVLERFDHAAHDDGYTLLECKLFTGRTHQIRVHMQYIRHPVVGDPVYSAHAPHHANAQLGLTRQFLHSYRLGFTHPETGDELAFSDILPPDLRQVLEGLASRSRGRTLEGQKALELIGIS